MPLDAPPHLHVAEVELGGVHADASHRAWLAIPPITLRECLTSAPPRQPTEVRIARCRENLRVLFTCHDTEPWATLTERDAPLYTEEVVEVFLDPIGDLECYFEIEVNPRNAVLDLVLRKSPSGLKKDFSWQCEGLQTAVKTTPTGWTAELSIPCESLLPDSATMTPWRANFLRIDRPPGQERELSAWSPTGFAQFHVPHRFGYLHFGRG